MIRAVLFDYGGVLSPGGLKGCVPKAIASVFGIEASALKDDMDIFIRAPRGEITEAEYFAEFNRRHPDGPRLTRESYMAAQDIFVKSEPVYALAERLRVAGIKTGILSNINDIAGNELRRRGFYDGFEPVVLSFEEKIAKPDTRFYEIAVERLGVRPEEVVFIDDQERCHPPAEGLGMHFILAVSPQQIVDDVTALLQKENNLTAKN